MTANPRDLDDLDMIMDNQIVIMQALAQLVGPVSMMGRELAEARRATIERQSARGRTTHTDMSNPKTY